MNEQTTVTCHVAVLSSCRGRMTTSLCLAAAAAAASILVPLLESGSCWLMLSSDGPISVCGSCITLLLVLLVPHRPACRSPHPRSLLALQSLLTALTYHLTVASTVRRCSLQQHIARSTSTHVRRLLTQLLSCGHSHSVSGLYTTRCHANDIQQPVTHTTSRYRPTSQSSTPHCALSLHTSLHSLFSLQAAMTT